MFPFDPPEKGDQKGTLGSKGLNGNTESNHNDNDQVE